MLYTCDTFGYHPRVMFNAKNSIRVAVGKTKLDGCIVLNAHNTVVASNRPAIYMELVLPWAHPSPRRKRHLDRFSRFSGLTRWQSDWQTDRPHYSVSNNRRSSKWRSQILLLFTATTSKIGAVDSTDRINFSNQQLFSCKIRRVAVYVETPRNIALKRAFSTGVLDR